MSPLTLIFQWIAGLLTIALLVGGVQLIDAWYESERLNDSLLAWGAAMLVVVLLGRPIFLLFLPKDDDRPHSRHDGTDTGTIKGPHGEELYVERHGAQDAMPVIMTHGWNLDSTAWYYEKKSLAERFRLVLWDLPGLGRSTQPKDKQYSLERMADDLKAVIDSTPNKPAMLIGHSIGGMTILTYCRKYRATLQRDVAGIILVDTTYTMPLNTMIASGLMRAIKRPVIIPLMYLTVVLWPVVWAMNWLSYLNGSAHLATWASSFSRKIRRGQLDFATRFTAKMNPGVVARGNLAMLKWDETGTLPGIDVPVLIVSGNSDRVTLPQASEDMRKRIPDAELIRVDYAGHPGFIEQDSDYDAAMNAFIAKCQGKGAPERGATAGA